MKKWLVAILLGGCVSASGVPTVSQPLTECRLQLNGVDSGWQVSGGNLFCYRSADGLVSHAGRVHGEVVEDVDIRWDNNGKPSVVQWNGCVPWDGVLDMNGNEVMWDGLCGTAALSGALEMRDGL